MDIKLGSEAWTPFRRYLLGTALLAEGKEGEARDEVRELSAVAAKLNIPVAYSYEGILALETGQRGMAQAALAALGKIRAEQPNSAFAASNYYYVHGAVALSEGRAAEALRDEQRAYAFYVIPGILCVQGDAYTALGQWEKAADSYRTYLAQKGQIFNAYSSVHWALAHIDLARALARAGKTKEAALAYDAFLKLWAGADPNLPALREARTERTKLGADTAILLPR